ncbi:hypothetical protein AAW14_12395 [Streptomyces hygroscopicus]|uniref:hypothetical protein n=1 Tax=Streptomyces hygroscopicus TaxID=1912 RepID=UPI00223F9D74|nr:hypothetical protein [Streptomyces hygroscopicus]MCW7942822.1 hypothetical protein [Streptomyces hygroscopicus]
MTNTTAAERLRVNTTPARPRVKMSIRVYRVVDDGTITEDRGTVTSIDYGEKQLPKESGFPPCTCPRCRAGQAVMQ